VLLIGIILIQRGRGGGLTESFSDVESVFGTKTNTFLTRTTTVLSILFFLTCLSLAFLSAQQSKSLLRNVKTKEQPASTMPTGAQTATEAALPQSPSKAVAPKEQVTKEIPKQEITQKEETSKTDKTEQK
jgi:preprotein translocase subunit SecG